MKKEIYMAPLEGITTYCYRMAYHELFHNVSKYYTPFIMPHTKRTLNAREKNEILPENNKGLYVVPQILTNKAEDFINIVRDLKEYGYSEFNINLGCPSGTVTAKGRGAGFLAYQKELDIFLEQIYHTFPELKISIKTRIGIEEAKEFEEILKIYNKYPIYELIIHPRVLKDYYKNQVHLDTFLYACQNSKNPLVYNGDVFTKENADKIAEMFPGCKAIMLGRGLIANPCLVDQIMQDGLINKEMIRNFHDKIYAEYQKNQSGDKNVLYKMKEIWSYMGNLFTNYETYAKKINKSEKCYAYEATVNQLFREENIKEDAQFSWNKA